MVYCNSNFHVCLFQLSDVIKCRHVIYYYAEKGDLACKLLLQTWQVLREIVYILQIPYRATIELQRNDLTLSDVYGIWTKMMLHLEACKNRTNYKTSLARLLYDSIERRKNVIYENPFMCACLFLDPRFRNLLLIDENKTRQAKQILCKLWQRINHGQSTITAHLDDSDSSNISFDFNPTSELDNLLNQNSESSNAFSNNDDIASILDAFDEEQISSQSSILEYWEANKNKRPKLYQLAKIVYAVPPTEVPIERDFSRLNYIFSDRRCQLQSERLEDIMIINLNSEIFFEVKAEECYEEEKKLANNNDEYLFNDE